MDIAPILKKTFSEGSLQGQCAEWAHKVVDFPSVGDSYSQKKKAVEANGILMQNLYGFRRGDVCVTSEGTIMGFGNGHVTIVADIVNGNLIAAESNFRKDQRIHYGRVIPKNKIYGIFRGKFKVTIATYPIQLKMTVFMQYQKPWQNQVLTDLQDWIAKVSGGKVLLTVIPLYTYDSLKNWWYLTYFQNYNVIAKEYFDEQAMPLRYPDSHIVLWSINKDQWKGSLFNSPGAQELGWYYPGTNPMEATIVCDEMDMSFANFGLKAFFDYARHEMGHWLYEWGRTDQFDFCHNRFFGLNGYPKNFDLIFNDFDLDHLAANIL